DTLRRGLQQCAELVNRQIEAAFVRMWTMSEDGEFLLMQASAGTVTTIDDEFARLPLSEPVVGRIARTSRPFVTNELHKECPPEVRERVLQDGLVAFAGYPLLVDDRVVGVATAFAKHPLTQASVQAFESIMRVTAQFIERKRAEES